VNQPIVPQSKRYRITFGGEEHFADQPDVMAVCDDLVARLGPGVPNIADLRPSTEALPGIDLPKVAPTTLYIVPGPATADPRPPAVAKPPTERIMSGEVDIVGEGRSILDREAAEKNGFSTRETVYRRGKPVIKLGEENAQKSLDEHNARDLVGPACDTFISIIEAEKRRDVCFPANALRMDREARLITPFGLLSLTEAAFSSLLTRTKIGGGSYLNKCWPELRAKNFNNWMHKYETEEKERVDKALTLNVKAEERDILKLRLRNGSDGAIENYAIVSPSYSEFNVDKIAKAIKIAMPHQARADFNYDGHRASFDILFHSDVQPKHYVAGEFFKAGIRVLSSDNGDGSIIVSAIVWQNLCLNLLIIDESSKALDRIRHIGSVDALAARLKTALEAGKKSLSHFLTAWDYAVEDIITPEKLDMSADAEVPLSFEDALPGIFNGLAQRELVPLKRPEETVPLLMKAWRADKSGAAGPNRAAIVNAITRYAHEGNSDPWYQDKLERAAGALLHNRTGRGNLRALPYVPMGK
jgi:hypothetical protein